MGRNINYFKLGLFIVLGAAVGVGAAIWLGISHYFEQTKTYVSYFNESVKGLQKDALVNYRGVPVGRVTHIGLAPDGRLIEIIMGLQPQFQVSEGLSIRLRDQGLTGLRFLEIDKAPENLEKITPQIGFPLEHPLIPSSPSDIEQLRLAFESIYSKVLSVDLEGLVNQWTATSQLVNDILTQGNVVGSLQTFHASAQRLDNLVGKVSDAVDPKDLEATFDALNNAARQASVFMNELAKVSTRGDMQGGLKDLSATLAATRKATEALARQLDALPPKSLANISKDVSKMFETGSSSFSRWDEQVGQSLVVLQQNLQQLGVLLNQLTSLAQSFKDQPGRLLFGNEKPDPFRRSK